MAKSAKRKKLQDQKRARKRAEMLRPGGNSRYARKLKEQRNGKYRRTSPFRIEITEVEVDDAA